MSARVRRLGWTLACASAVVWGCKSETKTDPGPLEEKRVEAEKEGLPFSSSCQSWEGHSTDGLTPLEGPRGALFDEIWKALLTHHTDPTLACLDWPRVRETFGPKVAGATEKTEAAKALEELFQALGQPLVRAWLPGAEGMPEFHPKRMVTVEDRDGKKILVAAFNQWDPTEVQTTMKQISTAISGNLDAPADPGSPAPRVAGVVMDLRGPSSTGAGVLPAVAAAATTFAAEKVELGLLRPRSGDAEVLEATPKDGSLGVPLHVVVDGDTDGGAAIVARAWKTSGRAKLYGEAKKLPLRPTPTTLLKLSGGGVLRLVVADFHPPAEKTNWSTPKKLAAVEPDVVDPDPLEAAIRAASGGAK